MKTEKTYRLHMVEHIDHIFYCSSKERADEIAERILTGDEPEDFPDEYSRHSGIASFSKSTNIT